LRKELLQIIDKILKKSNEVNYISFIFSKSDRNFEKLLEMGTLGTKFSITILSNIYFFDFKYFIFYQKNG